MATTSYTKAISDIVTDMALSMGRSTVITLTPAIIENQSALIAAGIIEYRAPMFHYTQGARAIVKLALKGLVPSDFASVTEQHAAFAKAYVTLTALGFSFLPELGAFVKEESMYESGIAYKGHRYTYMPETGLLEYSRYTSPITGATPSWGTAYANAQDRQKAMGY